MVQPPAAATAAALKQAAAAPLFRFGLLSDVQYADKEDGQSFHGTPRYYRYALQQLDRAVSAGWGWRARPERKRRAGVPDLLSLVQDIKIVKLRKPNKPSQMQVWITYLE